MRLRLNSPVVLESPLLEIDAVLKAGVYRYRLEVLDTNGNRSVPAEIVVRVEDDVDARAKRLGAKWRTRPKALGNSGRGRTAG